MLASFYATAPTFVGKVVAVDVGACYANPPGEGRGRGIEARQHGIGAAVGDGHLRATAPVGRGDDVGKAIVVNIAGRHPDAAGEGHGQREEVTDHLEGPAVDNAHFWRGSRTGTADDVGRPVAVDVADRHAHTTSEVGG